MWWKDKWNECVFWTESVAVILQTGVCTCLSRAILSHSRSCLLALSCRSSFLICSTCQAESRHCHRYSPTQSDNGYDQTLTHSRNPRNTYWAKMLNNRKVNAVWALLNWWAGFPCLTAFHPFIVIVMPNCQRHKVVVQKKDKPKTPQVADSSFYDARVKTSCIHRNTEWPLFHLKYHQIPWYYWPIKAYFLLCNKLHCIHTFSLSDTFTQSNRPATLHCDLVIFE